MPIVPQNAATTPAKNMLEPEAKSVLGNPPLIADTSSTICTRFNSRNTTAISAPPLQPTEKPKTMQFSELTETRV